MRILSVIECIENQFTTAGWLTKLSVPSKGSKWFQGRIVYAVYTTLKENMDTDFGL